jgi:ubiquinone/menaquinone biosynthesis C-methylase UbiE
MLAGFRGEWFAHILEGCGRILDVGCGFGFPSLYLSRCGSDVIGVDASPSEVQTASQIAKKMRPTPRVSFQLVEQGRLPFADKSFDGAALSTSLECAGDPVSLMGEVRRVLRPGSPVAVQEEDRSLEAESQPVWEKLRWAFFDDTIWLWYEVRIRRPYRDRRYMLRMDMDGRVASRLASTVSSVLTRTGGLPTADFSDSGVSLECALSDVVCGEWSEAQGFDPWTLKELLDGLGFEYIQFWLLPDGKTLADSLRRDGLLHMMPLEVRTVLRAVLRSMQSTEVPVSCTASCRTA